MSKSMCISELCTHWVYYSSREKQKVQGYVQPPKGQQLAGGQPASLCFGHFPCICWSIDSVCRIAGNIGGH